MDEEYKLPEGWEWLNLRKTIKKVTGAVSIKLKKNQILSEGKYPIIDQGQKFIVGYTDKKEHLVNIDLPVILFGDHTKSIKYINFDFGIGADGVKILKPIENINPKYFYYMLKTVKIEERGYGRHYKYLMVNSIPIPFPNNLEKSLEIQQKIVDKLDLFFEHYEKLKEEKQKAVDNYDKILAATISKLIPSNEEELPEGWEPTVLKDISEIIMGQSPPSSTYNKEKIGLPFFQGKKEFGEIFPKVLQYCSEPKKIAEKDSILLCVRAPVGPVNIANVKCVIGRGLSAIKGNKNINQDFLWYFMKSNEIKMQSMGRGSTFKAINKKEIENIPLSIPYPNEPEKSLEVQKQIVEEIQKAKSIQDKINEEKDFIQKQLEDLPKSVLAKAFRGELI